MLREEATSQLRVGHGNFGHEPRTRAPSRVARSARHVVMYTE